MCQENNIVVDPLFRLNIANGMSEKVKCKYIVYEIVIILEKTLLLSLEKIKIIRTKIKRDVSLKIL